MAKSNGNHVTVKFLVAVLLAVLGWFIAGWVTEKNTNDKAHTKTIGQVMVKLAVMDEKLDRLLTGAGG